MINNSLEINHTIQKMNSVFIGTNNCTIPTTKNQWKDIDQPDDNFPSDIFEPYRNPQRPR